MVKKIRNLRKVITTAVLILGVSAMGQFTAKAAPEEVLTYGNFTYKEIYGGVRLLEYHGPEVNHVIIPGEVEGKKVREFGSDGNRPFFQDGSFIKRLTIEEGAEEVSYELLEGCDELEVIDLPASIWAVDMSSNTAFGDCEKLEEIRVVEGNPNYYTIDGVLYNKYEGKKGMTYYPSGKRQKTYRVPEGIKNIFLFGYNPYLEKIILPRSVRIIDGESFARLPNLKTIVASEKIRQLTGGSLIWSETSPKIVTYEDTFLWKYAKKEGIKCAARKIKNPKITGVRWKKGRVRITWSKNEDATGYMIYKSSSKNGTYSKVKEIKKTSQIAWKDRNVKKKEKYYYKVRAYRTVSGKKIYSKYSKPVGFKK